MPSINWFESKFRPYISGDYSYECDPEYCNYMGLCYENDYKQRLCDCRTKYYGENCELQFCDEHDYCGYRGVCVLNEINERSCVCDGRHFGESCQYEYCDDTNFCIANGLCYKDNGVDKCKCYFPYYGEQCENEFKFNCDRNCNNGTCYMQDEYKQKCDCFYLYYGDHCQNRDCVWSAWSDWSNCSSQCFLGNRQRTRYIDNDAIGDGKNCTGEEIEDDYCYVQCDKCDGKEYCSDNGDCFITDNDDVICVCNDGFAGDNCQEIIGNSSIDELCSKVKMSSTGVLEDRIWHAMTSLSCVTVVPADWAKDDAYANKTYSVSANRCGEIINQDSDNRKFDARLVWFQNIKQSDFVLNLVQAEQSWIGLRQSSSIWYWTWATMSNDQQAFKKLPVSIVDYNDCNECNCVVLKKGLQGDAAWHKKDCSDNDNTGFVCEIVPRMGACSFDPCPDNHQCHSDDVTTFAYYCVPN